MKYSLQASEPLFPDLVWAEAERSPTKPVLIIGGHRHNLQAPLVAYQHLSQKRLTTVVALPDVFKDLKNTDLMLCDSTPAGSFSQAAYRPLLEQAQKSVCLLVAGDLSANQETRQLVSKLIGDFKGQKIVVGPVVKSLLEQKLNTDPRLTLILDQGQFSFFSRQHGCRHQGGTSAEIWADWWQSLKIGCNLIAQQQGNLWIKNPAKLCLNQLQPPDLLSVASQATYYLAHCPEKTWEALTTAVWQSRPNPDAPK